MEVFVHAFHSERPAVSPWPVPRLRIMLSIIIPTLNEERYLSRLLDSIREQHFPDDHEVIVADAGSSDGTVAMALEYGCQDVSGGLPAKGKNEGAKAARGDILLFIDGDAVLPEGFISSNLSEFERRGLDIAGFLLYPYGKNASFNLVFDMFYNWWPALALEKYLPHAANGILVKKSLHERMGGFDEEIRIAEDHAYARAGAKIGRFGVVRSVPTLSAPKRFEFDGWASTYLKYLLCEVHMIFVGPVKSDIFKYRFGHYQENSENPATVAKKLRFPFKILQGAIGVILVVLVWIVVSFISVLGIIAGIISERFKKNQSLDEN